MRRALAESLVGLRAPPVVVNDMMRVLGPVPPDQQVPYEAVHEIYGTCRMNLAMLDQEVLSQTVSGKGCEFSDLLEPLRRARPSNGGPAWSEDLVMDLRLLNFELG